MIAKQKEVLRLRPGTPAAETFHWLPRFHSLERHILSTRIRSRPEKNLCLAILAILATHDLRHANHRVDRAHACRNLAN